MPAKKRDAESTRERILTAAQLLFTRKGFDGAGIRDIAAEADVNMALIGRYFGSKKRLFESAILSELEFGDVLELEPADFADEIAKLYLTKEKDDAFDPMLAIMRSLSNPEIASEIREALEKQILVPLSKRIGGSDAKQRAALLLAQLAGVDLMRRIMGFTWIQAKHVKRSHPPLKNVISDLLGSKDR